MSTSHSVLQAERYVALRGFGAPAQPNPEDVAAMAEHMVDRFYQAGTQISTEGTPVLNTIFVIDGAIETSRGGTILRNLVGGEVLGLSALAGAEAGISAVATKDTFCYEIPTAVLLEVIENNFTMMSSMLINIAHQVIKLRLLFGSSAGFSPPESTADDEPAKTELGLVERIMLLKKLFRFDDVKISALTEMARGASEVNYAKGEVLWDENDPATCLLILISGSVRCSNGKNQNWILSKGDSCGAMAAIARSKRWFKACATEPVVVLAVDAEMFIDVVEENPDFGLAMLRGLASLLDRFQEQLAQGK